MKSPFVKFTAMVIAAAGLLDAGTASSASDRNKAITEEFHAALQWDDPSKPMDAAARKRLAGASFAYWQAIDSVVPRPSPAEMQWLEKELSTSDSTRMSRAASTPAFALRELSFVTNNCLDISKALESAVGEGKASELYLWLKLTQCYYDPDDIRNYEEKAGLKLELYRSVPIGFIFTMITGKVANSINAE